MVKKDEFKKGKYVIITESTETEKNVELEKRIEIRENMLGRKLREDEIREIQKRIKK